MTAALVRSIYASLTVFLIACPREKTATTAEPEEASAVANEEPVAPTGDPVQAKKHVANIKWEALIYRADGQQAGEPLLFNDAILREKLKATTKTQGDFNLSNRLVLVGGQGKKEPLDDWQTSIASYTGCDGGGSGCDPAAAWVKSGLARTVVLRLLVDDSELARWSFRDVFPVGMVSAPNANANVASLTLAGEVSGFRINGKHPLLEALWPGDALDLSVSGSDLMGDNNFELTGRVHSPDSLLGLIADEAEGFAFADGGTGLAFGRGDHPFVSNFALELDGVRVGTLRSLDVGDSGPSIVSYKDGEDGVSHTRPGNHKPGKMAARLGDVTMKKAEMRRWRKAVFDGKVDRRSISVIFHNDAGEEAGRMSFDAAQATSVHVHGHVGERTASADTSTVDELVFTYGP